MTDFLAALILTGLTVSVFMIFWFLIGLLLKNNGLVDIAWGLGFVCIGVTLFLVQAEKQDVFNAIYLACLSLWGLRLAIYLGKRNLGKPEDFRYASWRKEWGKWVHLRAFFQVYVLQGTLMIIIALPLVYVLSRPVIGSSWANPIVLVGLIMFFAGWLIETVSDYQKSVFKRKGENRGKFIQSGLWAFSRHPNYFGEILVWWGLWLMAFNIEALFFVSIVSPLLITFLLLKVSGIPMLEAKYKGNVDYDMYKRKLLP